MINKLLATIAVGVIGLATITPQSSAVPITGGVSFSGQYTAQLTDGTVTTDLLAATRIAFGNIIITGATGTFAANGVGFGDSVTMATPLVFDPPTLPVGPLYTVESFSFTLTSLVETPGTEIDSLELRGFGNFTSTILGLDSTPGTFIATFNTAGGTFSFSASGASVPDGGTTVALLGLALLGVAGVHRKFATAA
jgi:hypothetical protein